MQDVVAVVRVVCWGAAASTKMLVPLIRTENKKNPDKTASDINKDNFPFFALVLNIFIDHSAEHDNLFSTAYVEIVYLNRIGTCYPRYLSTESIFGCLNHESADDNDGGQKIMLRRSIKP